MTPKKSLISSFFEIYGYESREEKWNRQKSLFGESSTVATVFCFSRMNLLGQMREKQMPFSVPEKWLAQFTKKVDKASIEQQFTNNSSKTDSTIVFVD